MKTADLTKKWVLLLYGKTRKDSERTLKFGKTKRKDAEIATIRKDFSGKKLLKRHLKRMKTIVKHNLSF